MTDSNTAISIGTSKEASLYFDYVIPLCLALDALPEFVAKGEDFTVEESAPEASRFFAGLLPIGERFSGGPEAVFVQSTSAKLPPQLNTHAI